MPKITIIAEVQAKEAAEYAQSVIEGDKIGRHNLYEKLGLAPDDSVK